MTSSGSRLFAGIVRISRVTVFVALFTSPSLAQTSPGIPGVLAPGVAPELVQGGFTSIEGPVSAADGTVYFSDRLADAFGSCPNTISWIAHRRGHDVPTQKGRKP